VFWVGFIVVVFALLAIDLGVFQRKVHEVRLKEAAVWSLVWIVLSLAFGFWIYSHCGRVVGMQFFAGYLTEYALSVDNIFVFILIFSYFSVPPRLHHKVLFWGILGALVMRAAFILAGALLIERFHWMLYIFGAFLVFTGCKILFRGETETKMEDNMIVKLFRRFVPMTTGFESEKFFSREKGKRLATPLVLVLVTVEATDVVFATDSIPAIFGITQDPFIIYTSNVCAILGLRSMYFLLASVMRKFAYLGAGLGLVLTFIGVKMLISDLTIGGKDLEIPIEWSLSIIAAILGVSIGLSIFFPPKKSAQSASR
jgi:tellurite resistance protein TerC